MLFSKKKKELFWLVLLQNGNVVEKLVGLRSEQELAQVLSRYANGNGSK